MHWLEAAGLLVVTPRNGTSPLLSLSIDEDGFTIAPGCLPSQDAPARRAVAERRAYPGTARRSPRHKTPATPAPDADEEHKEGTNEEHKVSASARTTANLDAAPRRHLTGAHQMPTDNSKADEVNDKREALVSLAKSIDPDAVSPEDEANMARIVLRYGNDADLVVRWLYSATKGTAWDRAEWHASRGIKATVRDHGDRLLTWSKAWDKAGRPSRATASTPTTQPAGPTGEAVWAELIADQFRRACHTMYGIRVPGRENGVPLHADPDEERRRFDALGGWTGWREWSQADNDWKREQVRKAFVAAYDAAVRSAA